jgi:hypothetical protein
MGGFMKVFKPIKIIFVICLGLLVSNIPNIVSAQSLMNKNSEMISASVVLSDINHKEAEREVQNFLKQTDIQNELIKQGVSPNEASSRLASLSERELQQLSTQVKEARAGGDILVAILLVVLIIYLIKRI